MKEGTMTNSRILMQEFDYYSPTTLPEALHFLKEHGVEAKVMAGGTDLLVQMKQEIVAPKYLINIRNIQGLCMIEHGKDLKVGAAVLLNDVVLFFKGDKRFRALSDALECLAEVQVRNMGTVGGNLCNASPAADSAPPLLVYDAKVKLANAQGERILPLEDFFKDVNKTDLSADEMMTEILLPYPEDGTGGAFMKTKRVGADISKISCAISVKREGDICLSSKIAFGSVAKVPIRIKAAENALRKEKVNEDLLLKIGELIMSEINPISDIRSTAVYRKEMAKILFLDVFDLAWKRAGEKK
jgi:CO/xanthine dehydrogenase FAD-binding subunit